MLKNRHFFITYVALISVGLVIVFREFVFSDRTVYSPDLFSFGMFFRHFLGEHFWANMSIPGWNPYDLCGQPFVDSIHGATFYPLQWIDILVGGWRICVYNFMLHYLIAGIFTYLAVRKLYLSRVAAAVAGVSYMFAPCLISWVRPGHDGKIFVAALFPVVMFFLIRMFRTRRWLDATLAALSIAAVVLTAHLQLAYYVFLAIGFYFLWQFGRLWRLNRSLRAMLKPGSMAGFAVVLGLILSSVQFLPSYEYLTKYSLRSQRLKGLDWAGALAIRAEELISHFVPEFSGNDSIYAPRAYWGKNGRKDNSESIGLVPILLAAIGIAFGRSRQRLLWALMAFLAMIYALGPSTFLYEQILMILPYAHSMQAPSGISFVFCFCVAVLAAYGVHELWFRPRRIIAGNRRKTAIRIALIGVPVIFTILIVHFVYGEQTLTFYCRLLHPSILPHSGSDSRRWLYALNNLPNMRQGFLLAALYSSIVSLIVWKTLTVIRSRRLWLMALIPLIMVANGSFSSKFVQLTDLDFGLAGGPVVDVIKEKGEPTDRTSGFVVRPSWFQFAYYKLPSAQGFSTRQLYWYSDIAGWSKCMDCLNANFANLAGTRYILCPQNWTLPLDTLGPVPLDTVAIEDSIVILENHNRFPRTFLVGDFLVEKDNTVIRRRILNAEEDLRTLCYLNREPSTDLSRSPPGTSSSEISYYSPDSVVVEVETPTNQLLILTDCYYPSWHAFVDGHETEILRAYGTFRAVEVPAGSRQVVFRYDSFVYSLGKYLSITGLIIAALVLGLATRQRQK